MKKNLLLTGLCLFGTAFVFAQLTIKPAIGLNFTSINGDGSRTGGQAGGSVAIGKRIYIEPGFFYISKNTQYQPAGSSQPADCRIGGIRVPLVLGINLLGKNSSTLGLHAFTGVSAMFLTHTTDIPKDDVNSSLWGAVLGAGLNLPRFFLDASYEWSLNNLSKDMSQSKAGKPRSLFVTAGIKLAI